MHSNLATGSDVVDAIIIFCTDHRLLAGVALTLKPPESADQYEAKKP